MPAESFRVIRFLVDDGPIWTLNNLIALDSDDRGFTSVGESCVETDGDEMFVSIAVLPFRDLSIASDAYGKPWREIAVTALKAHFRKLTPTGVLRLYRDPNDGTLRNLAE